MAPNGETLASSYTRNSFHSNPAPRLSMEGLQRAMSDLSFEMSKEKQAMDTKQLPSISEVEDAKCECCGMSEECTPGYICRVRDKFCGRWICGLCSEAVKEEGEKKGVTTEDALEAHMGVCDRFNRIGRTQPLLGQAEAMREILKKCSRERAKSSSPRDKASVKKGSINRSSSCIAAITKEM